MPPEMWNRLSDKRKLEFLDAFHKAKEGVILPPAPLPRRLDPEEAAYATVARSVTSFLNSMDEFDHTFPLSGGVLLQGLPRGILLLPTWTTLDMTLHCLVSKSRAHMQCLASSFMIRQTNSRRQKQRIGRFIQWQHMD